MKVKQLFVLLAAPAVVSINAFDDDLAWQYDDNYGYDDDDDYDDRNEGFISSGPSSGFVAESLMQDRSEGYVSTSFNGTTTVLESYGEEHGRELAFAPGFTFGICIGMIAIVGLAFSAEMANGFYAHQIPLHSDIITSKVSALKVFNDDNEQQFLFKLSNSNGKQLDPKKYLDVTVVNGAGECRQDMPHDEEEMAWVTVLCPPPNGGNLVFKVVAAKTIKRKWKLEIFPMHGRSRVLGQSSTGANANGDIILGSEEYGHYWMKRAGKKKEGGQVIKKNEVACTLIASKLPELNSEQETRSAVIMKSVFEKYRSKTGEEIIKAMNAAAWAWIINGSQRTLQSTEEDEYGFGITSTHTGRGDALRVRIYSDSATINLAHTMHGGDGSWYHINNRYIMKSIPQGSTSAPMQTAIVSVSDPGEFRVVLDHDGDGQGLAGIVGITPYNGGNIQCTNPEYIDEDGVQCAWTVLDNGVVEAYFRVY